MNCVSQQFLYVWILGNSLLRAEDMFHDAPNKMLPQKDL